MNQSENGDRISELPDALLVHILSFFLFKQSVQTSILSKRWLRVWMHLPLVDVDDSTLLLDPIVVAEQSVHSSFINFMSNVFNRCNEAPISKFILKSSNFEVFRVNQWITAAVNHRIQELDLCITLNGNFKISSCRFAYRDLVSLKLGGSFALDVQGSLVFPCLKELFLDYIEFDDDIIHSFLSGCPVLENLIIYGTTAKWNTLVINAPALRFLTIDAESYDDNGEVLGNGCDFQFILESPNLEVLNFTSYEAFKGFCFGNLNSLIEARIDVCACDFDSDGNAKFTYRGIGIATGIANDKIISLAYNTLEILTFLDIRDLPIFNNVTELRVGVSGYDCGKLLSQLLHNSPKLEVLVLDAELVEEDYNPYGFEWYSLDSVPVCVSQYLKRVRIRGIDVNMQSVADFINYLQQNGDVLIEY